MYADFLREFLPLFKKNRKHKIYLETNGTLPDELEKVIDQVDIIAMDFKLPSSTKNAADLWREHDRFFNIAAGKELFVKAVITDGTGIDDIKKMGRTVAGIEKELEIILQPVTSVNDLVAEPDGEMVVYFKKYLEKQAEKDVLILGQMHKCMGIK